MSAPLTFSLAEPLQRRLEAAAAERQTSPESIIEFALTMFLDESDDLPPLQGWQLEQIEAGIAAADSGDFASDEEVERVFAKYRS